MSPVTTNNTPYSPRTTHSQDFTFDKRLYEFHTNSTPGITYKNIGHETDLYRGHISSFLGRSQRDSQQESRNH